MMTIGGSWGTTLLVGSAMLLILGLTFMFLTRSLGSSSLSVRRPMTGPDSAVRLTWICPRCFRPPRAWRDFDNFRRSQ
jgi:hypothetical protein